MAVACCRAAVGSVQTLPTSAAISATGFQPILHVRSGRWPISPISAPAPLDLVQRARVSFRSDKALGASCIAHARTFFNRSEYDLASAVHPTFALSPEGAMHDALRIDYGAMTGMIFGDPPAFAAVVETIAGIETRLNAADKGQGEAAASATRARNRRN